MRIVGPALDSIHNDLKNLQLKIVDKIENPLQFNKEITLNHIHYNYPNASRTALKDINMSIPVRKTVGLVGATGSGKTAIADIILSLLEAQQGTLQADGIVINKNNQRAFGQEPKDIHQEAVEKAAKIANLHEFVINELPLHYKTTIGERGVRLSGGQRQRIGIARALYFNPQVLILDEATSALDNLTEKYVMDAVNNLSKHKTIIMIAHRLSTVKKCDKIFLFEKGELKNEGTFDELINKNENFKKSVIN